MAGNEAQMSASGDPVNINTDNPGKSRASLASRTSDENPPPRVLVVEDDESVAEVYSIVLQSAYDVDTAPGGAEALEKIDDGYDVILLDRRLPEISGDEVLEIIHQRGLDCQVVMVTAIMPDLDVIDLPWTDYVVKPVGAEILGGAVERALRIDEYSDRRQELTSKKITRNVLETELDTAALDDSTEYQRLCAEITRLEAEVATLEDEPDDASIAQAL